MFASIGRCFEKHPLARFALIIAAGIGLIWYPHTWHLESVAHAISEALIVAGVLGVTVDRWLKVDLVRDMWGIIIGWALPDEIKNHIREITKTSIVKRNYRLNCDFSASPSNPEDVIIDITEEWVVFNYGSMTEEYKPHLARNIVDNLSRDSIECTIRPQIGEPYHFNSQQLNSKKNLIEEPTRLHYKPDVKIPLPYQPLQDYQTGYTPACTVKWKYRLTKKRMDCFVNWSTSPTILVKISINCDCGLSFEFDPKAEHVTGSTDWVHPGVFMPLQVWLIRWYPTPEPAPKGTKAQSTP